MELSIIIPVYNTERYLKECLDSVLPFIKDKDKVEVILIDDGSTDHSSKIYESYHQPNFKYFQNKNHGVSYSRNFGMQKASGKWIMFLDSDDLLLPNWYPVVSEFFSSREDIIYFFGKDRNREVSKSTLFDNIVGIHPYYPYMTFPGARMFQKSFLKSNQIEFFCDIINGEDLLFNLESLSKTNHYRIVESSIYQYRYNVYSSTKKFQESIFVSDQLFQKELRRICLENHLKKTETYIDFCLKNAIFTFINRLSFLEKKLYRSKLSIFDEELYHHYLEGYQIKKKIGFVDIVVFLVKKKHYDLAIFLVKGKRKLKQFLFMKKKEDILEEV